jgi:thiol-disulfide isomerase/thioredoxin
MKFKIFITGMLAVSLSSFGQDAKDILKKTYDKCQSIQNGYYEMSRYMKFMSGKDTSKSSFNCYFKKLKDDSLYSSAFHYKQFWEDEYTSDVLYTGNDFVTTYSKDSTGRIMSKEKWAKEIKSYSHNYTLYSPITNRQSKPLPHDSDFIDNSHIFKFIGEENLINVPCYHIQVNEVPENESTGPMEALRIEFHYWITKSDYVPIQFSTAYDMVMNNDTMYQYERDVLNKYEINNLKDENILTLNSIPAYYKMKDFVPYNGPALLPKDTIAPNWELLSLTDEKISLNDLKGQLVLIDFFYMSCYPCMKALPALKSLNEKYKDKGLRIIGIDPYDKKEDDITTFLSKRGVTYTVLLGGKDAAKDYHVSGYPTMYLIDKTGKIIFIQQGYGETVEKILDDIIAKNL